MTDEPTEGPWGVDLSNAKVEIPLALMTRLMAIEEHAGKLRDAVESIGAGSGGVATYIRADCRRLVRAYDEGAQV